MSATGISGGRCERDSLRLAPFGVHSSPKGFSRANEELIVPAPLEIWGRSDTLTRRQLLFLVRSFERSPTLIMSVEPCPGSSLLKGRLPLSPLHSPLNSIWQPL